MSHEEKAACEERAASLGLTVSEWARQVLLDSVNVRQDTRLILSEVLGLRALLIGHIRDPAPDQAKVDKLMTEIERRKDSETKKRIEAFLAKETGCSEEWLSQKQ